MDENLLQYTVLSHDKVGSVVVHQRQEVNEVTMPRSRSVAVARPQNDAMPFSRWRPRENQATVRTLPHHHDKPSDRFHFHDERMKSYQQNYWYCFSGQSNSVMLL
jgi:hypothetical protein